MDRSKEHDGRVLGAMGSFLSRGVVLVRGKLEQRRAKAQAYDAKNKVDNEKEMRSLKESCDRFHMLVEDGLKRYVPNISQNDIDSVPSGHHGKVAAVLEQETLRIREILSSLMRSAEFPLASQDRILSDKMDEEWFRAKAKFHLKAFSELRLPRCFGFRESHGSLDYEPVYWEADQYSGSYIGSWTNLKYLGKPILQG
jgi:hypothetical protein